MNIYLQNISIICKKACIPLQEEIYRGNKTPLFIVIFSLQGHLFDKTKNKRKTKINEPCNVGRKHVSIT